MVALCQQFETAARSALERKDSDVVLSGMEHWLEKFTRKHKLPRSRWFERKQVTDPDWSSCTFQSSGGLGANPYFIAGGPTSAAFVPVRCGFGCSAKTDFIRVTSMVTFCPAFLVRFCVMALPVA
jgi:hypothetical protein